MKLTLEQKKLLLRKALIEALADCQGYLLPEPILLSHVSIAVDPVPLKSEFDSELKSLESEGYVTGIRPELGGPVKWKLTDLGRSAINS